MSDDRITVACPTCHKSFHISAAYAGKQGRCSACGTKISIPAGTATVRPPEQEGGSPPATDRQKEFARELGIDVPANVTRREISKLIDAAVEARDMKRYDELDELSNRESEAYQRVREEVIEELRDEGRLLADDPESQLLEHFSNNGLAAVVITFDEGAEFPGEVEFSMSRTDGLSSDDLHSVITLLALKLSQR